MHSDIGHVITILLYALVLLLDVAVATVAFWAGVLALRYVHPNEPRKDYVARGLALCASGFVSLGLMYVFIFIGFGVTAPLWLKIVTYLFIGLALVCMSVSIALMLPDEFAKMRRAAKKARESGEGFWVSRHNDG